MTMPQWNPSQKKAIDTRDKNILVSASAGAGKTTVLIARLSDLVVKQHIGIDHILAMTFTEAAANEMKKRLSAELYAWYEKTEDETEKQYLSSQLSAMESAYISTIHSFCLRILQEFYYIIGLSAETVNHIMSEAESQIAKKQAMEEVLHRHYEAQSDAFYRLCVMFSPRAEDDEKLQAAIRSVASMANAQSDPQGWLNQVRCQYDTYATLQDLPEAVLNLFFDDLRQRISAYRQACEAIQKRYQTIYGEEAKKIATVEQKCAHLSLLDDALQKQDYNALREAFIAISHIVMPTAPDKEDVTYNRLRKQITDIEDTLLGRLYEESLLLRDIADLHEPIDQLVELCMDYMDTFARLKRERQCIDFDDMEHFALQILQADHGAIAMHYRNLFDEIMVDEFQDSNDIQNELVKYIARENNVFRVGDIKQSIYGFRHALPQLMRSLIDQAGANDEVIYLSNNYRSKKMIVDFNNALFRELMNVEGFDSRYDTEDEVACGVKQQEVDNVPIVFHAIDAEAVKESGDMILSTNEIKASYIASQIIEIREREQRSWKDFVVLVRANERKKDLKAEFDRLAIPCFVDVSKQFYQSSAVSLMLSVCNALADPYDDIHFAAAMLSPLFQMSVEEMSDLRLQKQRSSYYDCMLAQEHPLIKEFETLRHLFHQDRVCDLLDALYQMNHYYEYHTNAQERTNLDLLTEQAIAYDQSEGKGIMPFLRSLNEIRDMESSEAMPIGSEDDVVRVMSIHQSKGLQFPVVFLWSNSAQSAVSFREPYLVDSELGLGMMHLDHESRFMRPSAYRMALEHKICKAELEEEMRILYVATTRPQQQLHIVDCVKQKDDVRSLDEAMLYERGGYTSWILHSRLALEKDSLLQIRHITQMWEAQVQPSVIQSEMRLARYEKEDPVYQVMTPSIMAHPLSFHKGDQAGMRYGTRMHAYIEALPKGIWGEEDFAKLCPLPSLAEQQALRKLNADPLFQTANAYSQVYHELPFTVKDGNRILHGFMDFAAIGDDIIIIDFKTDHVDSGDVLIERYREQLSAYEQAMHILYPKHRISTYIYSLSLHQFFAMTRQKEAVS